MLGSERGKPVIVLYCGFRLYEVRIVAHLCCAWNDECRFDIIHGRLHFHTFQLRISV